MSDFILDCSMTMAWCHREETSPRTNAVLACLMTKEALVPNHWWLEVANVLATWERRGRIDGGQITRLLDFLNGLPIVVDDRTAEAALGETLSLALKWRLSTYDAAYLELALREGIPLASLDEALKRAAAEMGIALFQG
ncbi:MAG: type II toxin-antitoxin system VapC family toxin [Thermoguttaceae bacterium]